MPVWGRIFRALDTSDARARVRLNNLVAYIESLQAAGDLSARRTPSSTPSGSELFQSHCATCHGATARGDGALSGQLRHMPPDLTKFTTRNGGVFPSEKVRRIIDGRDVMAHGDRSMPVWGNVFSRQRDSDESSVAARIEALVVFLQSIQERAAE
jgi:mono/diheme cytochrome c family protein